MTTPGSLRFRDQVAVRRDRLIQGKIGLQQLPPQWDAQWEPLIDAWVAQIEEVILELDQPLEVFFTLLGGTGAGKSTLVNALLDADLLPVGSMEACTAAVCEIGFQESGVSVAVEFVSAESWREEIGQLAQQMLDRRGSGDGVAALDTTTERNGPMSAKLLAVYPADQVSRFFETADPSVLVEPATIANLLLAGHNVFEFPDVDSARSTIQSLLSTEAPVEETGLGVQRWPLVKRARITGPFEALRTGAKLVDLPGLNDPNSAREAVTRDYLASSHFVWVVYNMRRALTKDITEELEESGLFRRLVTEGRAGSLAFIGTAADAISAKADRNKLGLAEDSTFKDISLARRSKSEELVRVQLHQLADRIADAASHASSGMHAPLQTDVDTFPILTTSAQDYLALNDLFEATSSPILDDEESTGIPALVRHLEHTLEQNVGERRTERLRRKFAQIDADVQAKIGAFRSSRSLSSFSREEVAVAGENAGEFLDAKFANVLAEFDSSLAVAITRFDKQFEADTASAAKTAKLLQGQWHSMPWNTLQACCRREGKFAGSTGYFDIGGQVSASVMNSVMLTWVEFFGKELAVLVEEAEANSALAISAYRMFLVGQFDELMPDKQAAAQIHALASQEVEAQLLTTMAAAMPAAIEMIQKSQVTLSRLIEEELQAGLIPAYSSAAEESGPGMRDRMASTLFAATLAVLDTTLQKVHETLRERLADLRAHLSTQLEGALGDAHTSAVEFGVDLVAGFEQAHSEGVERMAVLLTEWIT